jgi:Fic family protein
MQAAAAAVLPAKSMAEFNAICSAKVPTVSDVFSSKASFDNFKAALRLICVELGVDSRIREHGVKTVADKSGASVIYPHHNQVDNQLAELFKFLSSNYENSPHFCAVVAHLGIGHIHPLSDGNGRLSRAIYNWMINPADSVKLYLPLHELAALSDGGYIIRFRKATYQNDWSEIMAFFTRLVIAFRDWDGRNHGEYLGK